MKKLALLITLPELGGAQTHVQQILAHIDRRRFEPVLLTAGEGWLTEQAAALGVRTYSLGQLRREIHPLADVAAVFELHRILKRERPDILHLHSSKAGLIGRVAGRLAGVPRIVFTAHGFSFHARLRPAALWAYVWLERLVAPLADAIVPVSDYDTARALRYGVCRPEKLQRIYNGISTHGFEREDRLSQRDRLGAGPDDVLIGMVARFAFPKDQALLLRALAPLMRADARVRLVLVGSGPEEAPARALASQLGIAERVLFLGDREDVPELLAALDVLALASRFESLPITLIEGMAAGLPVVASDVGGVSELVESGGNGFCVPPDDELALREALLRLIDAPRTREALGGAGQARARSTFDVSTMVERLMALYENSPRPEEQAVAVVPQAEPDAPRPLARPPAD